MESLGALFQVANGPCDITRPGNDQESAIGLQLDQMSASAGRVLLQLARFLGHRVLPDETGDARRVHQITPPVCRLRDSSGYCPQNCHLLPSLV